MGCTCMSIVNVSVQIDRRKGSLVRYAIIMNDDV